MSQPPALTRQAIVDWLGANEVRKGTPYADDGAVSGTVREGNTLKANVRGTASRPYRAWAKLKEGKVASADCSCPVGDGGGCKHVAALLLTYLADPPGFAAVDDLDTNLNNRDKAELVALIKQMVRREPRLEQLLAAPVPGFGKSKAVSPDLYRRQAVDLIRSFDPEDEAAGYELPRELDTLLDTAREFERKKEYDAAAAVFQGVAAAVVAEEIDYLSGYDGDPDVVGELAGGLLRGLTRLPEVSAKRESLLRSLYDLCRVNGDLGVSPDGDDQLDELLNAVTAAERRTFSGWLSKGAVGRAGDDYGARYRARRAAELLARVDADVMDDEAYLAHCRRFGMRDELVRKLVELKRPAEAAKVIEDDAKTIHELLNRVHLLIELGLGAEAERLVRARPGWEKEAYAVRWLRDRAAARKDAAEAAALTDRLLDLWLSAGEFAELKRWLPAADWPARREAVLKRLEKRKAFSALTDIHLHEKDAAEALRTFGLDPHRGRALEVAKLAEADHPGEAVRIYRAAAERQIEGRSRDSYREACKLLKKVRDLMAKAGDGAEFQRYAAGLSEKHRALRALQEEMRSAKLLAEVPETTVTLRKARKSR